MPTRMTDQVKIPQAFWVGLAALGLTLDEVLRHAKLPAARIAREGSLRTEEFFLLWQAIGELAPACAAGLKLVKGLDTAILPPSFLAAYHARDFRDALTRMARFKHLCSPEILKITEGPEECVIEPEWPHGGKIVPEALVDATFGSLVLLGRHGTRTNLHPSRVEYMCADDRPGLREEFYGCKVIFGSRQNRLVFRGADLDLRFATHNAELLAMLNPALEAASRALGLSLKATEQVRQVLPRFLSAGRPEIDAVAKELGMSARSLQRRITEEGSTFRDLLSQARQALAREYLQNPSLDLKEIVYLLGYEDSPSFYRAFRQWEGTTPAAWRSRRTTLEN
ncbi:AraC family transcriptional regulator [Holophaga foetida]|uniref:AraC family transcriptional regulator n=1 Tax=Holophaga foetida TaxID=35839 RepID=UPI00024746A6|nr:AraC family transcriptional regulator [Holophaga foetida]